MLLHQVERTLRVEAPGHDQGRPGRHGEHRREEAPRVEHGRGDVDPPLAVERDLGDDRPRPGQPLGLGAGRALRQARGATREDHDGAVPRRCRPLGHIARRDQGLQRLVAADPTVLDLTVGPGDERPVRDLDALHHRKELLVDDQQVDAFAFADVARLRSGEVGVQVQEAQAALGRAEGRVEQTPVVAGEQPDRRPFADTPSREAFGEGVRPLVELAERERPEIVLEADPVRVAHRGVDDAAARGAVLVHGLQALEQYPRVAPTDHPGPGQRGHRTGLDRRPFDRRAELLTEDGRVDHRVEPRGGTAAGTIRV